MFYTNYCNYNFSNPDRDTIDRPAGISEYLFLYFQTSMKIRLNGSSQTVSPGACILIPPHTTTYYQAVEKFKNSFIHFSGTGIDEFVSHYKNIPQNEIFYLRDINAVNLILKDIYTEYVSKDFLYEEQIDTLIRTLIVQISRQLGTSKEVSSDVLDLYDVFQEARLAILTHPERDWTSASMAELTHLGSSQFYLYYRDFFKRSPKSELLDVRLERAQYLLLHESFSIAVVAEYCGFTNLPHFTRYFKKNFGCTPSEFRKRSAISLSHNSRC